MITKTTSLRTGISRPGYQKHAAREHRMDSIEMEAAVRDTMRVTRNRARRWRTLRAHRATNLSYEAYTAIYRTPPPPVWRS